MKVEKKSATRWFKCVCCSEQIRTDEKYWQVTNNGKNVRGERYCLGCEQYAYNNNPEADPADDSDDDDFRRMQAAERRAEDYAAYRAAGCSSAYWEDRDAGYCY